MRQRSNRETSTWSAVNFKKTLDLDELSMNLSRLYGCVILASGYLVLTGVSSSKHGCPIPMKYTVNQGCMSLCQPVIWCMAAILRNSTAVAATVVRTRPRAIPLAMITKRKSTHGFPFVSHIRVSYGAPLGGPSGRRSSAINSFAIFALVKLL